MNSKPKTKKIIIMLAVLLLLVIFLIIQTKSRKNKSASSLGLVSGKDTSAQGLTADESPLTNLLSLIQSINTVTLNGSIFSRPDFKYLKDLSVPNNIQTGQYVGGRVNPFIPYDPVSNPKLTQTDSGNLPPVETLSIQTAPVQNIKATEVTLSANVSKPGARQIYFEYGKSAASFDKRTSMIITKEDGTATLLLSGLEANTTYFVRAVINDVANPTQGSIASFKTLAK